MSDAEYYIEQQEEEAQFRHLSNAVNTQNVKPLFFWTDTGAGEAIWDWQPLSVVHGIFADLHQQKQIGSTYFIASSVPHIGEEDMWDDEDAPSPIPPFGVIKMVGKWPFYLAENPQDAIYEVLVVSRRDAKLLGMEAKRQQAAATGLKQRMVAEMLVVMATYINNSERSQEFVFARLQ